VTELLAFVDEILQQRNNLKHDMQWNALCRAYNLRNTAGDIITLFFLHSRSVLSS